MKKLTFSFAIVAAVIFGIGYETAARNSGKVYWRGMVDNKVHLVIHGTTVEHKTIDGQTLPDGVHSFTAPLPRAEITVRATKLDGRGNRVAVIQQPDASNDFKTIIEIVDERGGAGEYLVEIAW